MPAGNRSEADETEQSRPPDVFATKLQPWHLPIIVAFVVAMPVVMVQRWAVFGWTGVPIAIIFGPLHAYGLGRMCCAHLRADAGGLTVFNPLRRYRFSWPEIDGFSVDNYGFGYCVTVNLRDGRTVIPWASYGGFRWEDDRQRPLCAELEHYQRWVQRQAGEERSPPPNAGSPDATPVPAAGDQR